MITAYSVAEFIAIRIIQNPGMLQVTWSCLRSWCLQMTWHNSLGPDLLYNVWIQVGFGAVFQFWQQKCIWLPWPPCWWTNACFLGQYFSGSKWSDAQSIPCTKSWKQGSHYSLNVPVAAQYQGSRHWTPLTTCVTEHNELRGICTDMSKGQCGVSPYNNLHFCHKCKIAVLLLSMLSHVCSQCLWVPCFTKYCSTFNLLTCWVAWW